MSTAINDFSHYAYFNGYIYIYKTPSNTNYTIQVIGLNVPDEVTDVSSRFKIKRQHGMGVVFRALYLIARINGDDKSANTYMADSLMYLDRLMKHSERQNKLLDKVQIYPIH